MSNVAAVRRYRERRPDRARLIADINNARTAAALRVAKRHGDEFEEELMRELRRRKLPRRLPRLPLDEDLRSVRHRA